MSQQINSPTQRMIFVDGLRGLAAVAIMLAHSYEVFHVTNYRNGWLAEVIFNISFYSVTSVLVFFVLSGFVIAYTLREARLTPASVGRFLLRRSIRLDPPYWVSIIFSLLVLFALAEPGNRFAAIPSLSAMLAHLFYLQDIVGYGEPINHIYWTLCIEIQMYLVFAVSIAVLQAMRLPYRPVLTIGLILSLGWPLGFLPLPRWRSCLSYEYCFLAGAVVWWSVERSIPRWLIFLAAGAFLAASLSRDGDYHIWVAFGTAILLGIAGTSNGLYTWLGSRPIQFLGSISYGLYLVHNPVIQLTLSVQRRLGFTSTSKSFFVLCFICVVSITIAYLVRRFVEVPSIKLSREFKTSPSL